MSDDEGEYDDDFTAKGTKSWGEQRYNNKLDRLAEVIGSINGKELPDIIVLSEIENQKVVKDLLNRKEFKRVDIKSFLILIQEENQLLYSVQLICLVA